MDQWKPPRSNSCVEETEMALAVHGRSSSTESSPNAKKKGGMSIINVGLFAFEVFLVWPNVLSS